MEYNKLIVDMINGDSVEGFYVLKDAHLKTASNGKPFLTGSISDRSASVEIKVWDYPGPIGSNDIGKIIKIRGDVSEFKGALQVTVSRIRLAENSDSYDISSLVPTAPIDVDERIHYIKGIINSLEDEDYKNICQVMLDRHLDSFTSIPAAKSVHHSFLSGLLMHTSNMVNTADFLSKLYADVIDRSLLISGTLLHDFAKEKEFAFSELGLVVDYSIKGQLLGHLVMGANEVAEVAKQIGMPEEKSLLLQHLLLSHHGEPDHGAAVRPVCAEAELLSLIDQIDSRMEIYAEEFETLPVGQFSGNIFALGKKIYNHG